MGGKLTTQNPVRLEEPVVPQVFQEFPAFYEAVKFVALFTTAHYLSVS
jgi:hypothetical protein